MSDNEIIMDFDETIKYVVDKTRIDKDTVEKVLFAESDYMMELGIIICDWFKLVGGRN